MAQPLARTYKEVQAYHVKCGDILMTRGMYVGGTESSGSGHTSGYILGKVFSTSFNPNAPIYEQVGIMVQNPFGETEEFKYADFTQVAIRRWEA